MSVPDVFRRITTALDQAGIGYMLTGSFASAHYGAPRSTQDIDLVIEATPAQLRAFVEALSDSEYYADLDSALEAHKRQSMFNVDRLGNRMEDRFDHPQVARFQPRGIQASPTCKRA